MFKTLNNIYSNEIRTYKMFWGLFVIVILFVLYTKQYLKKKSDFQVIQLEMSQITDETLMDKYPIYIEDRVIDVNDVIKTIFKYSYINRRDPTITGNVTRVNLSKYCVIHNSFDTEITVAIKNTTETVDFIIEPDRILVVPYMWEYTLDRTITVVELFDMIHRLVHIV